MGTTFRTLDDIDLHNKRVVVRLDLNMPVKNGSVTSHARLERSIPTLRFLLDRNATIIILSHFGRPGGKVVPDMSLSPIVATLSKAVNQPVRFTPTVWDDDLALKAISKAKPGEIFLMENTRFHAGEEKNDPALAKKMAELGQVYINDAFSASHRAHASTEGIAHYLPCAAGRAMEMELRSLGNALDTPKRPFIGIIGGAKISSKINLLRNLVTKMDALIISGGMANIFLVAKGTNTGISLCEHDLVNEAKHIMEIAKKAGCRIILPIDALVARTCEEHAPNRAVAIEKMAPFEMILDIGPHSISIFKDLLQTARTLAWNGPLGVFEVPPFDTGTNAIAQEVARLTQENGLLSIAGGGDTMAALQNADMDLMFSYYSTGGGAFLEWMEGKDIPGVRILSLKSTDVPPTRS